MVSIRSKALTSKQLASKVAQFASNKKALDIKILDMRGLVNFCDFFVLATGTSDRQVKAVAEEIEFQLSEIGIKAHIGRDIKGAHTDPEGVGAWALIDMGDVIAHVFEPNAREFYGLEHLWQDAPTVAYKERKKKA